MVSRRFRVGDSSVGGFSGFSLGCLFGRVLSWEESSVRFIVWLGWRRVGIGAKWWFSWVGVSGAFV